MNAEGFADDASLTIKGDQLGHMIRKMNLALERTQKWAEDRQLNLSKEKTVAILFTRKNKISWPNITLNLRGHPIEYVDKTKYLGFTLHRRLNWNDHIREKLTSGKRLLFKARSLISPNWGPHQNLIRWIYTTVVRTRISYGSVVWGHAITKAQEDEMQRVQGLALMLQGMFRQNTPRRGLEIILGIEPLHLHIRKRRLEEADQNTETLHIITRERRNSSFIKQLIEDLECTGVPLDPERKDAIRKRRVHERNFHKVCQWMSDVRIQMVAQSPFCRVCHEDATDLHIKVSNTIMKRILVVMHV